MGAELLTVVDTIRLPDFGNDVDAEQVVFSFRYEVQNGIVQGNVPGVHSQGQQVFITTDVYAREIVSAAVLTAHGAQLSP